ncbi:MAG: hypothetical protein U1F65_01555 [Verrucomicrobiota bacterium]
MKTILTSLVFMGALAWICQAAPPAKNAEAADPAAKPSAADKPVPKSKFNVPAKAGEGRDPFFPASDRLFAVKTERKSTAPSNTSTIVFNGISGSQDKRLAMINGRTFAEGEEAPVNTSSGRVRVLLVALRGDTAVVEVAGERRELTFQGR